MPYSECLGCNRFKDLKNNNDGGVGGVGLAVGMIVLIVVLVVVFVCCAGIACAACFIPAVAAFVLAIFCCRPRKSPEPTTMLPQTTNVAYPASNVAYPQTQYQTAYASDAYSTYGAPSLPPTYHGGSPSSPPSIVSFSFRLLSSFSLGNYQRTGPYGCQTWPSHISTQV